MLSVLTNHVSSVRDWAVVGWLHWFKAGGGERGMGAAGRRREEGEEGAVEGNPLGAVTRHCTNTALLLLLYRL